MVGYRGRSRDLEGSAAPDRPTETVQQEHQKRRIRALHHLNTYILARTLPGRGQITPGRSASRFASPHTSPMNYLQQKTLKTRSLGTRTFAARLQYLDMAFHIAHSRPLSLLNIRVKCTLPKREFMAAIRKTIGRLLAYRWNENGNGVVRGRGV